MTTITHHTRVLCERAGDETKGTNEMVQVCTSKTSLPFIIYFVVHFDYCKYGKASQVPISFISTKMNAKF